MRICLDARKRDESMITPTSGVTGIVSLYAKSTDSKPTAVANGSMLYEIDTQKVFIFDADTSAWIEQ